MNLALILTGMLPYLHASLTDSSYTRIMLYTHVWMCNAIELPLQILLRMANLLLWKFTNSWIVAQKTVGWTKEEKPFIPSKVHFSKSSISNPDPVQWISLTHVQSCSPHSPTHTPGYRLITTQLVHYRHDLCALSLIPLLPGLILLNVQSEDMSQCEP